MDCIINSFGERGCDPQIVNAWRSISDFLLIENRQAIQSQWKATCRVYSFSSMAYSELWRQECCLLCVGPCTFWHKFQQCRQWKLYLFFCCSPTQFSKHVIEAANGILPLSPWAGMGQTDREKLWTKWQGPEISKISVQVMVSPAAFPLVFSDRPEGLCTHERASCIHRPWWHHSPFVKTREHNAFLATLSCHMALWKLS